MNPIWVVEEHDANGKVTFLQEYTDPVEAMDAYSFLKEKNENRFLSITKSSKKLLVE